MIKQCVMLFMFQLVAFFLIYFIALIRCKISGAVLIRMHMTKKTAVRLKTDILNSMLRIFSMNAQTRTIFQEESGFVYVIAVLVSLEGSLADPAIGCWGNGMLILLKSQLKYP